MYSHFNLVIVRHGWIHRQREQLQRDIDTLSKDKSKLEATIEELRKQERAYRQELESTVNKIQESKAVLTHTTDELKAAQEQLKCINKQASSHVSYCYITSVVMFCFIGE